MKKSKALAVMGEPSELDHRIFQERIGGASERSLAKKYGMPSKQIWAAIDRCLPSLDLAARHRAIAIEHARLDGLFEPFYRKAINDGCVQSALLCLRLVERRSAMLGADIAPMRVDPLNTVAQTERKSSTAVVKEILDRLVSEHPRTIDVTPAPAPTPAIEPEPEPAV